VRLPAWVFPPPFPPPFSFPTHWADLTHRSAKRVRVWSVMHYRIAESGQWLKRNFKRFKEGTEERNLFLQQSQNIFIFSAYTDACTSSCKKVVASKRPLISLICISANIFCSKFKLCFVIHIVFVCLSRPYKQFFFPYRNTILVTKNAY